MGDYQMKFEVHVDDQIFNHKPASKTIGAISTRIITNLTRFSDLRLFAEKVAVNGQTFLPSKFNGSRKKENVIATNFLVIDFDNESSKGVALAKEEQATLNDIVEYFNDISLPPFFAYHSFSHSNNCEKFHMLWKLDKPIEYLQIYELAINMLMEIINLKYKNKVADFGASKNVAGMFFGSNKGIGYFDETNTLNLGLMFETLNNLFNLNTDDKNRHDARNLKRLYERLNISNYLKIFNNKKSESLLNENCGANLESNNILLVNQKCAQFGSQYEVILDDIYIKYINIIYKITFSNKITSKKQSEVSSNDTKTSKNSSRNRYINKYNVEEIVKELSSIEKNEILNPDLLKILTKHCCIIDKYINNQPMKHNDRFVLLSFLLNFKSGAKKYTQYLKKSSGKTSDTNMTSFIKNLYKVSFCNNKSDSCNENHNISHLYSDLKKNTIIRDYIDYYPVDEVRELLNKSMKENFKSIHKEQKVFLYIVDTGVGKTETAFRLINELQLDNYIMAFSLHEKKEEFENKVNQDVFISLELPSCLKEEHKMMITQTCIKRKSYIYYLKRLLSSQHYNEYEKEKNGKGKRRMGKNLRWNILVNIERERMVKKRRFLFGI